MLLNINSFFWDEDVEVREDGVLDEDVVEAFSSGHCHSFALALHREFSFELVGALWEEWSRDELDYCDAAIESYPYHGSGGSVLIPGHVLARDKDGRLFDIRGVLDTKDVCHEDAKPIPVELVENRLGGFYRPLEEEFAATFVESWKEAHLS